MTMRAQAFQLASYYPRLGSLFLRRCAALISPARPFASVSRRRATPPPQVVTLQAAWSRIGGGRRLYNVRATHVSDAGSIDSPLMQEMEKKIKEELNADMVSVKDAYGDGRHVSIDVISSAFEGKSAVNRQRMVYKAIWEEMQSTVHAVDQMSTKTPAEAEEGR